MAIDIVVPRLGWTMESGVFLGWLKHDGDVIQAGDMLYELEGEKAIQEVEATDGGILRIAPDAPQPGTTIPVGTLLARLVADGEAVSWSGASNTLPEVEAVPHIEPGIVQSVPLPPAAPSIRRLARGLGVDPARVVCSDPAGRLSVADLYAALGSTDVSKIVSAQSDGRVVSSPRARRVAAELGVDWTQLRGTGRTGRIREQDVRLAAASGQSGHSTGLLAAQSKGSGVFFRPQSSGEQTKSSVSSLKKTPAPLARHAPSAPDEQLPGHVRPLTPLRRTIAARMVAGAHATAPVTLTATVDATNLVALRERLKAESQNSEPVPTYNDLLLKLVASALQQHPLLNAQWRDEGIFVPDGIHIALAVQTDDGLVAPVIRNVPDLSLSQVAATTRQLVASARDKKLTPSQLQGGTFTLTNLGNFGIEFFTPIINLPQCAILGVGQIRREPVVEGNEIVVRDRLPLSLTFDHRIVDGAPAARFLQVVCLLIEQISLELAR